MSAVTSRIKGWPPWCRSTAIRRPGLGITPQIITDTLYDAFGQRQVSTIFTQLNQYRVILEVMPEFQKGPEALHLLEVRGSGGPVPLNVFSRVKETTAPLVISRQGQFPAVTISFNLAPAGSLGDAVEAIGQVTKELGLPPSIRGSFQGAAQAFQTVLGESATADPGGLGDGLYRARYFI